MTDPFVGQLAYFRVYSGVLDSGTSVLQRRPSAARRSASVGSCKMHANKREEIKTEVRRRRHRAAVGLKDVTTGDTICDQGKARSSSSR